MKTNGYVLWRGPSQLDGKPIVLIATGFGIGSKNAKTGDMIQTWILRDDISPGDALRSREDASICGDCKHRGRTCYVMVHWGVNNVWKAYKRGTYLNRASYPARAQVGEGQIIRIGTYGDPAAVPIGIWLNFITAAKTFTGYTHQWRSCDPGYKLFCMASVDSVPEQLEASAMGWRTFRVRRSDEGVLDSEVVCPASAEAGHKTTCAECRACGGLSAKAKVDIVIKVHGSPNRARAFENGDLFVGTIKDSR